MSLLNLYDLNTIVIFCLSYDHSKHKEYYTSGHLFFENEICIWSLKIWADVPLYMIFVHPNHFSPANIMCGRDGTEVVGGILGSKGSVNQRINSFRYGNRQDSKDRKINILPLNFLISTTTKDP